MTIDLGKADTLMLLKTLRFFAKDKTNNLKDRQMAERIHEEIVRQVETGEWTNSPLAFRNSL